MSDPFKALQAAFEEARKSHAYRVEAVSIEFTEELLLKMKATGLKRADLARKMGTSAPYVTKILSKTGNFTVDSLVKIADAVNCDLKMHLTPRHCESMWIDVIKDPAAPVSAADNNEFALAA